MSIETAGAVISIVVVISGIVFGVYKLRPESSRIFVESAKVSVELASDARDTLAKNIADLQAAVAEQRREHAEYRLDVEGRLAELGAELRAAKAEKEHVNAENERLRQRVSDLEAEVQRLKTANQRAQS
jgi:septal ring factor EnvC (AmiA/AmiB activator)